MSNSGSWLNEVNNLVKCMLISLTVTVEIPHKKKLCVFCLALYLFDYIPIRKTQSTFEFQKEEKVAKIFK